MIAIQRILIVEILKQEKRKRFYVLKAETTTLYRYILYTFILYIRMVLSCFVKLTHLSGDWWVLDSDLMMI